MEEKERQLKAQEEEMARQQEEMARQQETIRSLEARMMEVQTAMALMAAPPRHERDEMMID